MEQARLDGARRDLLETITHGPRRDIIDIYTTFPWPALCAEVQKLKIELREGKVLDGDFGRLATPLATPQKSPRKVATPAGFEGARDRAKPSETEPAPTENAKSGSVTHIVARRGCSKCSKAAHLAVVAANAVKNGDLYRALEILEQIAGTKVGGRASASSKVS